MHTDVMVWDKAIINNKKSASFKVGIGSHSFRLGLGFGICSDCFSSDLLSLWENAAKFPGKFTTPCFIPWAYSSDRSELLSWNKRQVKT